MFAVKFFWTVIYIVNWTSRVLIIENLNEENQLKIQLKFLLLLQLVCYWKIDFTFRSMANRALFIDN